MRALRSFGRAPGQRRRGTMMSGCSSIDRAAFRAAVAAFCSRARRPDTRSWSPRTATHEPAFCSTVSTARSCRRSGSTGQTASKGRAWAMRCSCLLLRTKYAVGPGGSRNEGQERVLRDAAGRRKEQQPPLSRLRSPRKTCRSGTLITGRCDEPPCGSAPRSRRREVRGTAAALPAGRRQGGAEGQADLEQQ